MLDDGLGAAGDAAESAVERAVGALLLEAHLARGDEVPALAQRHVRAFGGTDVVCYLADLQQTVLIPFLGSREPESGEDAKPLPIDTTLAGRAYQHLQIEIQQHRSSGTMAWLPLLDGTDRLGVVAVTLAAAVEELPRHGTTAQRLVTFAALLAELIMTKTLYGDEIVRLRRTSQMGLAAEIQWSLLPPLTCACEQVTVAAALEPAYEVAGDTVDYAVDSDRARLAVFDGMGHSLASAQLAAMAVSAYRHARRAGHSLVDTAVRIDQALLETFGGGAFTTAALAELDTRTGTLRWVNAGHPEPLLLRNGRVVRTLHTQPRPPLGIRLPADLQHLRIPRLGIEQLEPGDCVLFYTDGVVEARSPAGEFFGEQRLADLVVRNIAVGLPAPETMRRVVRALLAHQQGRLDDDATLLLVQWPTQTAAILP